jgi:sugar phosphate isomerase/epimerase
LNTGQKSTFYATLPYQDVLKNIDFLRSNSIGAEIAAHDTNWLLNIFKESASRKLGEDLRDKKIKVRAAGPIFDLNPGSLDHVVRRHTQTCFLRSVDLANSLSARSLVLPSGFNPLLPDESVEGWQELCLETWERVGESARKKGVEVIIKNVFDHSPDIILWLLDALEGLPFGVCLDVGHVNVYSNVEIKTWLGSFKKHLCEIHLHDNLGTSDDHLSIGEGIIDFKSLFRSLIKKDHLPPLTFDMEREEIEKSLSYIDSLDLLGLQLDLL